MRIRFIRHATLWLEYGGEFILVDPMLSDAGIYPPIQKSASILCNPLVSLPIPLERLLHPSMIVVTHMHRDHWDETAAERLAKEIPIFCQPGDERLLENKGFTNVHPIQSNLTWRNIRLNRTAGKHGTGEIGRAMGEVSGFVFQAEGEPILYLAGDTIYCSDVEHAIDTYKPEIAVVNAGGARFLTGDPITMTAEDVVSVCQYAKNMRVVAVHMNAVNHCLVTREILRTRLVKEGLMDQVSVPEDGEWLEMGKLTSWLEYTETRR